jgi:hypothetical protein
MAIVLVSFFAVEFNTVSYLSNIWIFSKFLFVAKDDVEQGRVNIKNVFQMKEIVQSLVTTLR